MTTSVYYAKREVLEARRNLAQAKAKLAVAQGSTPMSSETKFVAVVVGVVLSMVAISFISEIVSPYND